MQSAKADKLLIGTLELLKKAQFGSRKPKVWCRQSKGTDLGISRIFVGGSQESPISNLPSS